MTQSSRTRKAANVGEIRSASNAAHPPKTAPSIRPTKGYQNRDRATISGNGSSRNRIGTTVRNATATSKLRITDDPKLPLLCSRSQPHTTLNLAH